jgi:quinol monooxygenase YgiN
VTKGLGGEISRRSALDLERIYMTLRVVAHLRAQDGKGAELGEALEGLIEPTRAEPGNISYQLLASLDDERDFTFVEEYQDGDAFDAHLKTPHIEAALAGMPELLDGELDMRTYRLIA